MPIVYLGLGTNLGCREENLRQAVKLINTEIGRVTSLSSFYETAPWGFQSPHAFLNAAVCVETVLSPIEVLEAGQRIERRLGRLTKSKDGAYADRTIDIDILLYDDKVIHSAILTIPHPLITERDFVMLPLIEIGACIVHPELKRPLFDFLKRP